jgi:3-methyladenine DNA glycosylase AlkD
MTANQVRNELQRLKNPAKAKVLAGFFKTGPGQYGEGDLFLGITVPAQRLVAKKFAGLPLPEFQKLVRSTIHEERLTALLILGMKFQREKEQRPKIVAAFLRNLKWVNNWDLVDSSAHQILGAWLLDRDRALLYELAKSKVIWERRLAMVATYHFISKGEDKDAFAIAELLMKDEHDLMHKAAGWMLREAGKRVSEDRLRQFLKKNAARMPRTALRYSIERFSKAERGRWLTF